MYNFLGIVATIIVCNVVANVASNFYLKTAVKTTIIKSTVDPKNCEREG